MRIAIAARPRDGDILRRAVTIDAAHRVVWIATTGTEALERCARETPDLLLMGLSLDGIDGIEATRRIMVQTPCAILAVTANARSDARRIFEAMGHGALDAVEVPGLYPGQAPPNTAPLLAKMAGIMRVLGDGPSLSRPHEWSGHGSTHHALHNRLIAVGASAGGPAALATLLGGLPRDFPAGVVVIQHVDAMMAAGMAEWLGQNAALPVRVAVEGDRITPGTVLLASTNDHLTLTTPARLGYTAEPRDYVYRPSVDVFFQSVSRLWRGHAVGVLLTGMGRDGALGLKALRDQGRYTIAQDEASSAVYGMPKAAALLGAAVDVLPMDRIAAKLIDVVSGQRT